jgi:hypothetical protein
MSESVRIVAIRETVVEYPDAIEKVQSLVEPLEGETVHDFVVRHFGRSNYSDSLTLKIVEPQPPTPNQ